MTHADHPSVCQNCHTSLVGAYCHHCSQAAHNPLKSFAHAVEDVFESFWHLDGRIFRTLRELWIPGRIACNYLDGQRVRYLPPLRLFVIMSVFAFFVARLSVATDNGLIQFDDKRPAFAELTQAADVIRERDRLLQKLVIPESADLATRTAIAASRDTVASAAARRLEELEGTTGTEPDANGIHFNLQLDGSGQNWDPVDNPVAVGWLPEWANAAINKRLERLQANLKPGEDHVRYLIEKFVAALPAALFVMMPLLALVLRVVYLRRPMGYLEHLVVALYSHAWLLTALLVGTGLSTLAALSGTGWLITGTGLVSDLLWLSVPVYLWVMQRRVYGGTLLPHTLRFLVTGSIYGVLVIAATLYAVAVSLTS